MFFGQDPSRWQKKSLQLRHVNVLTTSWNANWSGKEFPGNSRLLLYKYSINTHKNTGVNEHQNVCSFAKLAGPVAHWMRRCVFNAESTLLWRFDSSQVRFGSFRCSCGQFLFVAVVSSSSSPSSSPSSCYTVNIISIFIAIFST